jgi:Tetracyclin repressor-like, C-terminal domain
VLSYLERLLGLLLAGGTDAQGAARAADILVAPVSYAAIEAEVRGIDPSGLARQTAAGFARLPADRFPLISAHIDELAARDADDRFRFAIDVVLDGVLARSARRTTAGPPSSARSGDGAPRSATASRS